MTAAAQCIPDVSPEWSLFMDWCWAAEVPPLPASAETIALFFTEVPAAGTTRIRRLQAIRSAHREAGLPLALPTHEPETPWRTGRGWLGLDDTLRRAPLKGWPSGLAARRDMFLTVLIGHCGFSREEARAVQIGDIVQNTEGSWLIRGRRIPCTPDAGPCPSCAVARWMKVLEIWDSWGRYSVREHVAGYRQVDEHECLEPVGHETIMVHTLLPGIDRHGWLADWEPLSARSISAILAYRQDEARWAEDPQYSPRAETERPDFQRTSMQDLTEMLDELDEKVAAALLESQAAMEAALAVSV